LNFIFAGLNIESTPVDILERATILPTAVKTHLDRLAAIADSGVILSTCNRTEIYSVAEDTDAGIRQLKEFIDTIPPDHLNGHLREHVFALSGDDVPNHLFNVTSGLHSVALGEPQILGQVSKALQFADENGTLNPMLSKMFRAAIRTGRRIRNETSLGRNRVSISSLGVQELQKAVGAFHGLRILLVGAGETGKLTARALRRHGANEIVVTSRSTKRGAILAEELGCTQIPFDQISESLKEADILISCTATSAPVISADSIQTALASSDPRPMYILDVGMPRDVDPAASDIDGVTLIDLSELQSLSTRHKSSRAEATAQAQEFIEKDVMRFKKRLTELENEPVIRSLGARVERMRREEVASTLGRLEAVERMTSSLVRRILADPIKYLRGEGEKAAEEVQNTFSFNLDDELGSYNGAISNGHR
jgi:glutamyl-tRNA reductase